MERLSLMQADFSALFRTFPTTRGLYEEGIYSFPFSVHHIFGANFPANLELMCETLPPVLVRRFPCCHGDGMSKIFTYTCVLLVS